jgi:predicted ArsR family transcriptional regulator
METITKIIPREPTVPDRPLDDAILAYLADGEARELRQITEAVGGTTHNVHARAQSLVKRGLLAWHRNPIVQRGPGASTYQRAER